MSPSEDTDYATLIAEAERAVAGVKDADLRRVAFEKILDTLLAGDTATKMPKSSGGRKRAKTTKRSDRCGVVR